jgi:hypothetical protein
VVLDVDAERAQAAWMHLDDVTDFRAGAETPAAVLEASSGTPHWVEVAEPAAPRGDAPPLAP